MPNTYHSNQNVCVKTNWKPRMGGGVGGRGGGGGVGVWKGGGGGGGLGVWKGGGVSRLLHLIPFFSSLARQYYLLYC
jgi:hypothetical protein